MTHACHSNYATSFLPSFLPCKNRDRTFTSTYIQRHVSAYLPGRVGGACVRESHLEDVAFRTMNPVFASDETLGHFLSRSASQRIHMGVPVLDRGARFSSTDVVELCGTAGAGKTEFLYAAALSHVLRAPNRHVVFLDLDHKFEPYRVSYLLQHLLQGEGPGPLHGDPGSAPHGTEERKREVHEAFERVHVFSCTSSLQLLATLKVLTTDFVPSLYERGGTLGAIVVDNVSAYWDVLQEIKSNFHGTFVAVHEQNQQQQQKQKQQLSVIEAIVHSLRELQNMCDVPVLVSRRVAREEHHEAGNRQWNDFVSKRASIECCVVQQRNQRDQIQRLLRWVKGEHGSTAFQIHASGIFLASA
jgi:RecA/RadA recombinase